jgi:hypothetical protein
MTIISHRTEIVPLDNGDYLFKITNGKGAILRKSTHSSLDAARQALYTWVGHRSPLSEPGEAPLLSPEEESKLCLARAEQAREEAIEHRERARELETLATRLEKASRVLLGEPVRAKKADA